MASLSVPIALCIKNKLVAEIVSETLLPEIKGESEEIISAEHILIDPVVQLLYDTDSLQRELPPRLEALVKGVDLTTPRVVILGGAFQSDVVQACRGILHANRVAWLQDSEVMSVDAAKVPDPEEMGRTSGERMKKCLEDHGVLNGGEDVVGAGELWLY